MGGEAGEAPLPSIKAQPSSLWLVEEGAAQWAQAAMQGLQVAQALQESS